MLNGANATKAERSRTLDNKNTLQYSLHYLRMLYLTRRVPHKHYTRIQDECRGHICGDRKAIYSPQSLRLGPLQIHCATNTFRRVLTKDNMLNVANATKAERSSTFDIKKYASIFPSLSTNAVLNPQSASQTLYSHTR